MISTKDGFTIDTDKARLDIPFIHRYLAGSYWAEHIPYETVRKSIEGSLCFGLYQGNTQIGFARLITDQATFAYLADVFVAEEYRGRGLAKWLLEVMLEQKQLQGLRRLMLATRDAHGLYARFGFSALTHTDRWMQIHDPDVYKR